MRDEIIALGIIPEVSEWTKMNPNLSSVRDLEISFFVYNFIE